MYLDSGAKYILDLLENAGYTAYAVGGCVRDALMGIPVSDYDIATPTTPQRTEEILIAAGVRFFETGLKHGTITAVLNGKNYEITTFRTESGYSDNRRPDSVTFVKSLEQDLKRRDFTVNAMAYHPKTGIVDLFGGRQDIENKTIRTVGDPDERFGEDALRILRALRFSSVLGFEIESKTAQSILKNTGLLSNFANERITSELMKMLEGKNFLSVFSKFQEVFELILPGVDKIYEKHAYKEFTSHYLNIQKSSEIILILIGSYICREKSEIYAYIERLKLPSNTINRIIWALSYAQMTLPDKKTDIKLLMSKLGLETVSDLAEIKNDMMCKRLIKEITDNAEPYKLSQLDVNGDDIIEAFNVGGKRIGEYLEKALEYVISNKVPNSKQEILKMLEE